MSLPEFVIFSHEFSPGERLVLEGQEHRHLAYSKRLAPGDRIRLGNGQGKVALCTILSIQSRYTEIRIDEVVQSEDDTVRLSLLVGLIKKERMDWAVQKLSEIGVYEIIPVAAERSVVRPDAGRAEKMVLRWQKIALSAMKQSRGAVCTAVRPIMDLADAVDSIKEGPKDGACAGGLVYLDFGQGAEEIFPFLSALPPGGAMALAVGPEGGFSPGELHLLRRVGATALTLGPRILRSETAAVVAAGMIAARLRAASFKAEPDSAAGRPLGLRQ